MLGGIGGLDHRRGGDEIDEMRKIFKLAYLQSQGSKGDNDYCFACVFSM